MASDDPPLTLDDDDIPAEVVQELNDQLDAFRLDFAVDQGLNAFVRGGDKAQS